MPQYKYRILVNTEPEQLQLDAVLARIGKIYNNHNIEQVFFLIKQYLIAFARTI